MSTTPPSITGPSGSAGDSTSTISIKENVTAVTKFTADKDVTWSLIDPVTDNIYSGLSYDTETGDFTINIYSQSESSILDVGGNEDGTKGFITRYSYSYSEGSYSFLDVSGLQNGWDYRGNFSNIRSHWITEWNGVDPIVVEQTYINSEGITYKDNYYFVDGTATNLPTNSALIYGIDIHDKDKFSINSSTGALSFSSPPDYETPGDIGSGNDYVVTVRATDSAGNTSDQTVTITIANSQELDVSNHQVGTSYHLQYIKDYDGNLHANTDIVSDAVKNAYKYQGLIDVNADGTKEAIYTNKESGRWVTGSINSSTGEIDYEDHGSGGTTRVVGIYIDPLVTSGEVIKGSDFDSQRRFQNDLEIDNLIVKTSGDYDGDGFQEVYWKTNDGTAYLRALMHADGNIQYANYQSEAQMSGYLRSWGFSSEISNIV